MEIVLMPRIGGLPYGHEHGCAVEIYRSRYHSVSWRVNRSVLPTCTVLAFTNSRMPKTPSSRPCPERLTPPNRSLGSDTTMQFTNVCPDSTSSINRSPSPVPLVPTLLPLP